MKSTLIPSLILCASLPCVAQSNSTTTESFTQTNQSSNGGRGSSTSVTTTSDGKTTVKKTVTVIDGVRKVVIETTDENGKTTRTESDGTTAAKTNGPWIGVRVSEVPEILRDQLGIPGNEGLAVEVVAKESPAMKSGIKKGDLLLKINDDPVSSKESLSKSLQKSKAGDEVRVTLMRKAKRLEIGVVLEKSPESETKTVPESLLKGLEKSSIESVDVDVSGKGFESLLNNPDLPESFKERIREMQKSLDDFEKKKK